MSQVIDLTCPKCGAPLEIHKELSELSCPYCGYKKALMESDAVKIERLRAEAYKEVALQKERLSQKSQKTTAASKKKKLRWKIGLILAAIFAVILLPVLSELFNSVSYSDYHRKRAEKTYAWPKSGLPSLIPQPASLNGEMYLDAGETLSVYAANTSLEEYNQYLEDCKESGFTIGMNQYSSYYEAYDEEGNYLDLSYDEDYSEMHIRLEKAIETSPIEWPENPLAQLLPIPPSLDGNVFQDSNDSCVIYLAGMTKTEFGNYARKCMQAGFSESYLQETTFYGSDENDNRLSMDYLPSKLVKIRISAPYR